MAPRALGRVALLAVVAGGGGLVASGKILNGGNEPATKAASSNALTPGSTSVTVLNGTTDAKAGDQAGKDERLQPELHEASPRKRLRVKVLKANREPGLWPTSATQVNHASAVRTLS